MCLFSVATRTASSVKKKFQDWLLYTYSSHTQFRCPCLGKCQDQYQFYSCICVCYFWGLTCYPSTPVILTFELLCGTKILYWVYLLSSIFFTYIFCKVVVTTELCIFTVVITTDLHWKLLIYYVYFCWGDYHRRILNRV